MGCMNLYLTQCHIVGYYNGFICELCVHKNRLGRCSLAAKVFIISEEGCVFRIWIRFPFQKNAPLHFEYTTTTFCELV